VGSRELAIGQGLGWGDKDRQELEGSEPDRLGMRLEEELEDGGQGQD
jgi:hypothetical protein